MKTKHIALAFALVLCLAMTVSAQAADVTDAIQSTWQAAAGQIKAVVNNVVFPAIDLILVVLFFVKLAMCYMDYRKHGSFEFTAPALLFAGLVLSLTAPLYLWDILGI